MVVSGDVFELQTQVDRQTVVRALEALGQVSLPVYLLPGNHDPLNEGSVYRSQAFLKHKPANIHILERVPGRCRKRSRGRRGAVGDEKTRP